MENNAIGPWNTSGQCDLRVFSSTIQRYGKPKQNRKPLYGFTTRTNGTEKKNPSLSHQHLELMFTESEGGTAGSKQHKAAGESKLDVAAWGKLEASLVIVMSFPSRMEICIPLATAFYSFFYGRDGLFIGGRGVLRRELMYTCCCVVLESAMNIFPGDFPFTSAFRTGQIFLLNDTRFFKVV